MEKKVYRQTEKQTNIVTEKAKTIYYLNTSYRRYKQNTAKAVRVIEVPISFTNILKTKTAVFPQCRVSIISKDLIFPNYLKNKSIPILNVTIHAWYLYDYTSPKFIITCNYQCRIPLFSMQC